MFDTDPELRALRLELSPAYRRATEEGVRFQLRGDAVSSKKAFEKAAGIRKAEREMKEVPQGAQPAATDYRRWLDKASLLIISQSSTD